MSRRRVAVVGSGIAGLAAAHILDQSAGWDVVLFEADGRLGGHSNTVTVDDPTAGELGVDTGFIVHNDRNYPLLQRLFRDLDVDTIDSEMSFAVTDRDPASPTCGLSYRATNPNTLFADRRNLVRWQMWRMLRQIWRFYRAAQEFLTDPDPDMTIAEFLDMGGYSREFIDLHLVAMGASVWSTSPAEFGRYPAASLFRFLDNHGLLGVRDRPQWKTVRGGSRSYVDALAARFSGTVRLDTPVRDVARAAPEDNDHEDHDHGDNDQGGAVFVSTDQGRERFDRVVLAVHSDQALALLAEPIALEQQILSSVRYQPNRATLHTDTTIMPPRRRAWAAWNYERRSSNLDRATLTYDLTNLQRLPGTERYLVSLNSDDVIDQAKVIASFDYAHPVFDAAAIEAQRKLASLDPDSPIVFAGAWCGYGFHEDGIASAVRACEQLGVSWPAS